MTNYPMMTTLSWFNRSSFELRDSFVIGSFDIRLLTTAPE